MSLFDLLIRFNRFLNFKFKNDIFYNKKFFKINQIELLIFYLLIGFNR